MISVKNKLFRMIYIFGKILKDKEQLTVGKLTIITNIIFI